MPWSLGGGPDTIARQVASYGDKYLGVPVIVENKTGGAGTIAMNAALQAADDGYTMVVANGRCSRSPRASRTLTTPSTTSPR